MKKILIFFLSFFYVSCFASEYPTFEKLWKIAGMDGELVTANVTLFLPTEEAFRDLNSISPHFLKQLQQPNNLKMLQRILRYHIVLGKIQIDHLKNPLLEKTLDGEDVILRERDGKAIINDAMIIHMDNDVHLETVPISKVYVIDRVLIPPPRDEK